MFFMYRIIEAIEDIRLAYVVLERRSQLTVEYFDIDALDSDFS